MTQPNRQSSAGSVPHTRIDGQHSILERYDLGRRLGEGSFGKVYEVTEKKTNTKWACKKISKDKAGDPSYQLLEREVSILKRVSHPHIICLKEVLDSPKAMYLILEFCEDGSLGDFVQHHGSFDEKSVKLIMKRLANAVQYLHNKGMVHRDLKLQNILLSRNPADPDDRLYIKVTDFGLSIVKDGVGYDDMMSDYCGTPTYMAPEIIANKMYSEKCDVWSMAVIMYSLFTANLPFQGRNDEELYRQIQEVDCSRLFKINSKIWNNVSDQAKDCLSRMFHKNTAYRCTASEVLNHPWITGEGEFQPNVLEILKQFHETNGNGNDDDCDGKSESVNTKCVDGSSDSESRSGSANSADVQKTSLLRNSSHPDLNSNNHKKGSASSLISHMQQDKLKLNKQSSSQPIGKKLQSSVDRLSGTGTYSSSVKHKSTASSSSSNNGSSSNFSRSSSSKKS